MLRVFSLVISWTLLLWLAGCVAFPSVPGDEIPAHVVINTVRCELARIVTDERYRRQARLVFGAPQRGQRDKKQTKLTLGLKIAQSSTTGVGVGVSNILAFGGALSLNFGIGASYANTVETQFVSIFPGYLEGAISKEAACRTKERMGNGIGLETAVLALVEQINKAESVQPYIKSESLKYTATFGVTREAKFGADFTFVPVKLSASDQEKREDVQTITFEGVLAKSIEYMRPAN